MQGSRGAEKRFVQVLSPLPLCTSAQELATTLLFPWQSTSGKAIHLWCYFFFELQQAENADTMVAGIVIGSLVFGLRPKRWEHRVARIAQTHQVVSHYTQIPKIQCLHK